MIAPLRVPCDDEKGDRRQAGVSLLSSAFTLTFMQRSLSRSKDVGVIT